MARDLEEEQREVSKEHRQSGTAHWKELELFHSMEVLLAENSQSISRIFPYHAGKHFCEYYGIGQNYGNWIFQTFSTIFPKYSPSMEEAQFSQWL